MFQPSGEKDHRSNLLPQQLRKLPQDLLIRGPYNPISHPFCQGNREASYIPECSFSPASAPVSQGQVYKCPSLSVKAIQDTLEPYWPVLCHFWALSFPLLQNSTACKALQLYCLSGEPQGSHLLFKAFSDPLPLHLSPPVEHLVAKSTIPVGDVSGKSSLCAFQTGKPTMLSSWDHRSVLFGQREKLFK